MKYQHKGTAKNILVWALALVCVVITLHSCTKRLHPVHISSNLTNDSTAINKNNIGLKDAKATDTLQNKKSDSSLLKTQKSDSTKLKDTTIKKAVDTLHFKVSKDSLDAPVSYHADDSLVMDVPTNKIILYGKENKVNYQDNQLVAPHIEFDQKTNLVSAYLSKDSTGKVKSFPTFTQKDLITVSDSIVFNMKTGKGLTKGTYTKQDEMYVYGETLKKQNADVFYAYRGRFTTCNLDTPHFAFVSPHIKFINNKMAITGPVHPEIEGVPLPITLPFGIFPLTTGRHSGLLAPTFTVNATYGLGLENMGFYKIINDNWDAVLHGTLYSYGGWMASLAPRYYKRYHYQGQLNLTIQHYRDLDNQGSRSFNITWNHSADTKSRPGVTFSANVNAGSSRFNSTVPNSPQTNLTNQMNSSINYAKVWKDLPFNLTLSGNHNQNTLTKYIELDLPTASFNINTQYPFRRKDAIGDLKWYENIGIGLNTTAKSLTHFYDTANYITKQIQNNFQWGASHSIPISLSLPPLGPLQISPSVSYAENWFQKKLIQKWNSTKKHIDSTLINGFFAERQMSFGFSTNTRIFGMMTFDKNSKVQAIRHEIRPMIGFSYTPNMNGKDHYLLQMDSSGKYFSRPSLYSVNVYSPFGEGRNGSINFELDNILQMKIKNPKDTGENALKKVSILDGFNISSSYNFLADSFKLAPFQINLRTNLFNNKLNFNATATTNPYLTDTAGNAINKYVWSKRPISLGTLTNGSITLSSSFKGGDPKEKLPPNAATNSQMQNVNSGMPLDEYQQEANYISTHPGEFANFNIPWSTSLSYSLNYLRTSRGLGLGYYGSITQNITFNGTLALSPKWQLSTSGFYNITTKEIGGVNLALSREMHCWQMAINIIPLGKFRSFSISISPKSAVLRDLKINRNRSFYNL